MRSLILSQWRDFECFATSWSFYSDTDRCWWHSL